MLVVVPRKERPAHLACVEGRLEAAREAGPVLERPELGLREGVVVGDLRAGVGLLDAEGRPRVFEVIADRGRRES